VQNGAKGNVDTSDSNCTICGVMPRYYCKPEHLDEILGNIESMSKILSQSKQDVAPEQWTLKDIYDQLKAFNGHNVPMVWCRAVFQFAN
jgi:hypothetical protein